MHLFKSIVANLHSLSSKKEFVERGSAYWTDIAGLST